MRRLAPALVVLLPVTALLVFLSCRPTVCAPGETQECYCPGGVVSAQTCADDGTSWDSCPCPGDDDDSTGDDDDTTPPPDDDDVQPDDDDVQPDDDDVQPDDDDVQPDDDDSGQVEFGEAVECTGDPTVCEDPVNCPFSLGCTCVNMGPTEVCLPNCETQADCPWKDGEQMECNEDFICVL